MSEIAEQEGTHIDDFSFCRPRLFNDKTMLQIKHWFREFRVEAALQDREYLESKRLTCTHKGARYRCIGASRMGDVWLTANMEALQGYERRVCVDECSDWNIENWTKNEVNSNE